MFKKIFVFMSLQCLSGLIYVYAADYNPRLLEMRADTLFQRVWTQSEMVTSVLDIKENLDFLNKKISDGSIKDFNLSREQCEQTMSRLRPSDIGNYAEKNFKVLIEACQNVYENGDAGIKTAVSLLFQTILSKSSPNIKRIEHLLKRRETDRNTATKQPKSLEYFLHADKSQSIISGVMDVVH